jgi:hypothetical protein
MDHDCCSPEWLDMSIAGMAISLDAFPTAPARTCASASGLSTAFLGTRPAGGNGPPSARAAPSQLLQMSIVGASDELPAMHTHVAVGAVSGCHPPHAQPATGAAMPAPATGRTTGRDGIAAGIRKSPGIDSLVLEGVPLAANRWIVSNPVHRKQTHDAMRPALTINDSSENIHAASAAIWAH